MSKLGLALTPPPLFIARVKRLDVSVGELRIAVEMHQGYDWLGLFNYIGLDPVVLGDTSLGNWVEIRNLL